MSSEYKYHSPAEWAGCRVTDSHPPTNEPCRQTFAARGRPRLSYREHHWICSNEDSLQRSLVHGFGRLTYSPSQNRTKPTGQSHRTSDPPEKNTKQTKTNSGSNTHHQTEEERDKGRETEKGAPGGAKILQALVTLVSTAFSLPSVTTSTTEIGTPENTHRNRTELQTSLA